MMPSFSPELISTMRAALDDVMTHIPVDQATSGIKIRLAEIILLPRGRPVMSCCTRRRSAKFRRCSHCSHRCKNLIGAGSTPENGRAQMKNNGASDSVSSEPGELAAGTHPSAGLWHDRTPPTSP